MRSLIFAILLVSSPAFALTQSDFAMGVGLESRMQRDVNPDYSNPRSSGNLYAKLRMRPWDLLIETARDEQSTGSGSLRIRNESTLLAAWARYEFEKNESWTPYVSLGAGNYFDKVSTTFQASHVESNGNRKFLGLSAGISAVFWDHFLVEGEARVLSLEQSKDPVLSGLIRVGCQM